jgi:hypothetical protein
MEILNIECQMLNVEIKTQKVVFACSLQRAAVFHVSRAVSRKAKF